MQSYFAPVYEQVKAHGIYIDRAHSGIPPEIRRWTMDNGRWTMDNGQKCFGFGVGFGGAY